MNVNQEKQNLIFINLKDYASLCDSLGERLKDQFTRNIFWISEQNTQNIRTLSNSIFTQLTNILVRIILSSKINPNSIHICFN